MDNSAGPPEHEDYSVVRANLGLNVRFTLRNSKWYSQNERADAFHRLGRMDPTEISATYIMIEGYIFDLTDA